MGADNNRFQIVAKHIKLNFPNHQNGRVADIAGGGGGLQAALRALGYSNVITYDPNKRIDQLTSKELKFEYVCFNPWKIKRRSLLVALHPDEATDVVIISAWLMRVPFVIVPCCVTPWYTKAKVSEKYTCQPATPEKKQYWCQHLEHLARSLGFKLQVDTLLNMTGNNKCIIGRPDRASSMIRAYRYIKNLRYVLKTLCECINMPSIDAWWQSEEGRERASS